MKAFPHKKLERGADGRTWDMSEVSYEGMDLRDYFAARALQGFLSDPHTIMGLSEANDDIKPHDAIAKYSYKFADAMMKARER